MIFEQILLSDLDTGSALPKNAGFGSA